MIDRRRVRFTLSSNFLIGCIRMSSIDGTFTSLTGGRRPINNSSVVGYFSLGLVERCKFVKEISENKIRTCKRVS